jgi:hypothetical protein
MDCMRDSELMPLCAAAAIAWGHAVDYPSLKLDGAQVDAQLSSMEAHLRGVMPVYGEDPVKVRKCDLRQAIERLRGGPLRREWWTVQQMRPRAARAMSVHFLRARELCGAT